MQAFDDGEFVAGFSLVRTLTSPAYFRLGTKDLAVSEELLL